MSAGGLVAYLVYTMMVAAPIASLAGLYAQFQSALGATERLFELLDTEPDVADRSDASICHRLTDEWSLTGLILITQRPFPF